MAMFIASLWTSIFSWFTPAMLFCVTNIIIATLFIASNNNNNNKYNDHSHSDSISRITRVSSFLSRTRSMDLSFYTPTTATANLEPQHNYEYQSKPPRYTSSSGHTQSIHQCPSYVTPLELSNDYETSSFESEQLPLSQLTRTPSILERVKSIKLSSFYSEPEHITNSSSQLDRVPSFFDRVKSFKISSPFTYETPSTQTHDHHVMRSKSENTSVIKKKGLVSEMKKSRSEIRIADDDEEEGVDLRRRPATTRERSSVVEEEVDAKAEQFISRFKQQLRLQRLESLARYTDMLKRRSSNRVENNYVSRNPTNLES